MHGPKDRPRWDLHFDILRSMRYHKKRQAWFENLGIGFSITSLAFASAAFSAMQKWIPPEWAQVLVFVAALASFFSLILRPSERARKHADLHTSFSDLAKQISKPDDISPAELHGIRCQVLDIEKGEPKHSRALNSVCYDEIAESLGISADPRTSWWKRAFAHILP